MPPKLTPLINGGDRIIFDDGNYRIGIKSPTDAGYKKCSLSYPYGCYMNPIPSGVDRGHPTRIYGENWNSGCETRPELFGVGKVNKIFDLTDSDNVELKCLDLTDHADCVTNSNHNYLYCADLYGMYGDYGATGIYGEDSYNVVIDHVSIHGLSTGVKAGRLGNWTVTNVDIIGNGFSGWNGDVIGDDYCSGDMYFENFTVAFAGCIEDYPDTSRIKGCWAQNGGGYGDGLGTGATGGNWTFINVNFSHSTSDGLDLLYLGRNATDMTLDVDSSLLVKNSVFIGNAGSQLKVRGNPIIENNVIIGNCWFFNDSEYIEEGEWLSADNCRAGGTALSITLNKGKNATIINNVLYGNGDTLIIGGVKYADRYSYEYVPEQIISRNNIFRSDKDLRGGDLCGLYWSSDNNNGKIPFNNDYSIIYGSKYYNGQDCKNTTKGVHGYCEDPKFRDLVNFDFRLLNSSRAVDSGIGVGAVVGNYYVLDSDINGVPRPQGFGVDMGPYEYYDGVYEEVVNNTNNTEVPVCAHVSDLDCDGVVSTSELIVYIGGWENGEVSIGDVIDVIGIWEG